jgi:DNA adenine methylase
MTIAERVSHLVETYQLNPVFATRVASDLADFSHDNIAKHLREKPRPFVKWVGGKRQLLSQFKERGFYPPSAFNSHENTYFEPFIGGGALYFDLLPIKASINDINAELVTTYRVIRDDVQSLITELTGGEYVYDKDVFLTVRSWNTNALTDLKRAARFIYLNRTAFNGLYRVNKSGQFNVPFGRYNNPQICDAENLKRVASVLQNTKIENGSYKYVLHQARKGDFIYFDPPYYPVSKTASFTAYSNDAFLQQEQIELRDTFVELHKKGCFVMLSNSDTSFIINLFKPLESKGIVLHRVAAGRNINSKAEKRGKVSEVLITNY